MDYISLVKTYSRSIFSSIFKIFIVIVVLFGVIALFVSFLPNQKIESRKYDNTEIYKILKNPSLYDSNTKIFAVGLIRTLSCTTIGEFCSDNPKDFETNYKTSLVSQISNFTVEPLNNPPASGIYYVMSKIKDSGLIPSSYAAPLQGIGFASLKPFQNIWLMFRNFVYLFFVIIIVIIGFMIMFRAKLNAQTAISVESALPKIVISILLVTFSFAIAGFLIDLMYVSIGVSVLIFSKSIPNNNITDLLREFFYNPRLFDGFWNGTAMTWGLASSLTNILPALLKDILGGVALIILTQVVHGAFLFVTNQKLLPFLPVYTKVVEFAATTTKTGTFIVSLIAGLIEFLMYYMISTILSQIGLTIIIFLLLIFTVILVLIRITVMVIYSYVNILLLTILSPLILAFEAIPGKSTFSGWLKSMIFHLMTFPVLTIIILLSRSIMSLNLSTSSGLWQPPGIGALDPQAFQTLIGASLIFMAPDLIKTLKQISGIKPMSNDLNLMGLFAGGMAVGGSAMGILNKAQSFSYAITAYDKIKEKFKKPAPLVP